MKFFGGVISFFLFLFLPIFVNAETSADFLIEGSGEVSLGEEFSLDFVVRNITDANLMSFQGNLTIGDTSCLELVSLEDIDAMVSKNMIVYSSMNGTNKDMVMARAHFRASSNYCSTTVSLQQLGVVFTDLAQSILPDVVQNITVVNHLKDVQIKSPVLVDANREVILNKNDISNPLTMDYIANPEIVTDTLSVIWGSNNTDVATIDSTGNVQILKPGLAEIYVQVTSVDTGETFRDSIFLNVIASAIGIDILDDDLSLYLNEEENSYNLHVAVYPEDTTDTIIFESSNPSVASVSSSGVVQAHSVGSASITVRIGAFSDTILVSVKTLVKDILLDVEVDEVITLIPMQTKTLIAQVSPLDASKKISWSSQDASIVSIDETGKLMAHRSGETVIVASCEGVQVLRKVKVLNEVNGLFINVPKQTLNANKSETLQLNVQSSSNSTETGYILWKSSDPEYASVSSEGVVTALKSDSGSPKEVVITATWISSIDAAHSEEVESKITVVAPLESIAFHFEKLAFYSLGESKQLKVIFNPDITSDETAIMWKSSDESVVKVSSEGVVTSVSFGTSFITATTSNGIFKTIEVSVFEENAIDSISISNGKSQMNVGETLPLQVLVNSSEVIGDLNFEYISSNEEIATIDKNGVITALSSGNVTFTVRVNGKEAKLDMVVLLAVHPKTGLSSVKASVILVILSLFGFAYSLFKKYQCI